MYYDEGADKYLPMKQHVKIHEYIIDLHEKMLCAKMMNSYLLVPQIPREQMLLRPPKAQRRVLLLLGGIILLLN